MQFIPYLENTPCYRIFTAERDNGTLSHAYLIVSPDADMNRAYAKHFAKALFCGAATPCGDCRSCETVEKEAHGDCRVYPEKDGDKIVVSDVDDLIKESYLKPVESARRVFLLCGAESMTDQAQNKLLKTLEEPPENVVIILIATSEFSLLSTVRSRVKKLEIPAFSVEDITAALADETEEKERLHLAAVSSGGMIGKAKKLLFDASFLDMTDLCFRILSNMQKSSDVAEYSACVMKYKANLTPFLNVMEICARDALMFKTGHKNLVMNKSRLADVAKAGFTFLPASLIGVIERCGEAKQALKTNANAQMVADTLLFGILEGKYQWRKS